MALNKKIVLISDRDEQNFMLKLEKELNSWDSFEILHYDHTYKNYKSVLLCENKDKQGSILK